MFLIYLNFCVNILIMQQKFQFDVCLSERQRVLFIFSENPLVFSYSLSALWTLIHYFEPTTHIFYNVDDRVDLLKAIFKNGLFWFRFKKEKELLKALEKEKGITFVVNLEYERPDKYDFEFPVPSLAVSKEGLKKATITYVPRSEALDAVFLGLLSTLNIRSKDFHIDLGKDLLSKARDFIRYKGHSEKNLLIVSDVSKKKEDLVKEHLSYITKDRLTFIGKDTLSIMDANLILGVLSISSLFISEASIYTYPAQILGVKTYLFPGSSKFLPRSSPKLFIDRGDFRKDIQILLPYSK